jgi:hypothetical protein
MKIFYRITVLMGAEAPIPALRFTLPSHGGRRSGIIDEEKLSKFLTLQKT